MYNVHRTVRTIRQQCGRYRTERPADGLADGVLLWKHEAGHGERQYAVGARVAVAVRLVGVTDEHVHRLRQRVLKQRLFLALLQLAVQSPHVDLLRRVDHVRVLLADVHHLDVLDAVRLAVDVEVDLEVDETIVHVRDRLRFHLRQHFTAQSTHPTCYHVAVTRLNDN